MQFRVDNIDYVPVQRKLHATQPMMNTENIFHQNASRPLLHPEEIEHDKFNSVSHRLNSLYVLLIIVGIFLLTSFLGGVGGSAYFAFTIFKGGQTTIFKQYTLQAITLSNGTNNLLAILNQTSVASYGNLVVFGDTSVQNSFKVYGNTYSQNVYSLSSENVKTNVQTLDPTYFRSVLKCITPISYQYAAKYAPFLSPSSNAVLFGFSAQNVQNCFPQGAKTMNLNITGTPENLLVISRQELIAMLFTGYQDHDAQIQALVQQGGLQFGQINTLFNQTSTLNNSAQSFMVSTAANFAQGYLNLSNANNSFNTQLNTLTNLFNVEYQYLDSRLTYAERNITLLNAFANSTTITQGNMQAQIDTNANNTQFALGEIAGLQNATGNLQIQANTNTNGLSSAVVRITSLEGLTLFLQSQINQDTINITQAAEILALIPLQLQAVGNSINWLNGNLSAEIAGLNTSLINIDSNAVLSLNATYIIDFILSNRNLALGILGTVSVVQGQVQTLQTLLAGAQLQTANDEVSLAAYETYINTTLANWIDQANQLQGNVTYLLSQYNSLNNTANGIISVQNTHTIQIGWCLANNTIFSASNVTIWNAINNNAANINAIQSTTIPNAVSSLNTTIQGQINNLQNQVTTNAANSIANKNSIATIQSIFGSGGIPSTTKIIWVTKGGNDTVGIGSYDNPFLTYEKATAVQLQTQAQGEIYVIMFGPGYYTVIGDFTIYNNTFYKGVSSQSVYISTTTNLVKIDPRVANVSMLWGFDALVIQSATIINLQALGGTGGVTAVLTNCQFLNTLQWMARGVLDSIQMYVGDLSYTVFSGGSIELKRIEANGNITINDVGVKTRPGVVGNSALNVAMAGVEYYGALNILKTLDLTFYVEMYGGQTVSTSTLNVTSSTGVNGPIQFFFDHDSLPENFTIDTNTSCTPKNGGYMNIAQSTLTLGAGGITTFAVEDATSTSMCYCFPVSASTSNAPLCTCATGHCTCNTAAGGDAGKRMGYIVYRFICTPTTS